MKSEENLKQGADVNNVECEKENVEVCGCDLTNEHYLKTRKGNIKIISIKLAEGERRQRRKEILKALIREDNA